MSEVYVYEPKCDDFANFGLVGALTPTSCVFEEEANGMSEITLEHPLDSLGRYKALETNNLLQVKVPVRTPPSMDDDGNLRNDMFKYRVRTASVKERTLYKNARRTVRLAVLPIGESVAVFSRPDNGIYEVCSAFYGHGWMSSAGLENEPYTEQDFDAPTVQDADNFEPAWTIKPQIFRIYEVRKNIASVTVAARHITYDLLYNTTTYKVADAVSAQAALNGIFNHAVDKDHDFKALSNIGYTRAGLDFTRVNIINALLDPDTGLCELYKAAMVRDNWNMYILENPGMDRGVVIEYARNMTGIEYIENVDEIATRIIPVGETKDGKPLLLTNDTYFGENWIDSPRKVTVNGEEIPIADAYPVKFTLVHECENCKVGSDGLTTVALTRARMREQVNALFEDDIDIPKIEMSVDFINLGDTEDYRQFRNLDRLFLFDYVTVRHRQHGINVLAKIVSIKWDCLLERMERMEIGSNVKTLANTQTYSPVGGYATPSLPSTGGTVDGELYLKGDPVDPMEAATKQYVDNEISGVKKYVDDEIDKIEVSGGGSGATFTPSVSEDGVISWTNDGGLVNPVPVNIKGPEGDPGYTPQKGVDYFDGAPGVGIVDITIEEVV